MTLYVTWDHNTFFFGVSNNMSWNWTADVFIYFLFFNLLEWRLVEVVLAVKYCLKSTCWANQFNLFIQNQEATAAFYFLFLVKHFNSPSLMFFFFKRLYLSPFCPPHLWALALAFMTKRLHEQWHLSINYKFISCRENETLITWRSE